jgi:hypothetical protein
LNDENIDHLIELGEAIIGLLGRLVFEPEKIHDVVTKGKRNPEKYIEGYNSCDGTHGVTELSRIIGVSPGTLSPILQTWLELGIIYETQKSGGTFYKKLFTIQ